MFGEREDSCGYQSYCQASKKSPEEQTYHVIETPSLPAEILNVRHGLHNRDETAQ